MKPLDLTPAQRETLEQMLRAQWSADRIANELSVWAGEPWSGNNVRKLCDKLGLPRPASYAKQKQRGGVLGNKVRGARQDAIHAELTGLMRKWPAAEQLPRRPCHLLR